MSIDNRLTTEQLAALAPGDSVTIETAGDFRRPRRTTGTVVRVDAADIVVKVRSGRGATYQELYRRRDGVRVGGITRAELVHPDPADPAADPEDRQVQRIHSLYRDWNRNRRDFDALRQLHAAIGDYLAASMDAPQPSR